MTRFQRRKSKRRSERCREAGRLGGIRSQEVQRERRMELRQGEPIYPVTPRWSIGLRDNWSGESGWITFISYRDAMRRLRVVMSNLSIVVARR